MHPILEQMVLSEEQWSPVLARGKDVVVTAGAGTGKTHTLVARYLSLLADGLPLRSIVAITFTRKAGREMRNRIREKIRCYISNYISKLSDEEERRRWEGLYAALDAARIGTIHSLCAEILRAHPAEAEVDPHFKVLEEGETALLRRRAVSDAMAWAASEQDVVPLFSLLGEEGLRKTLEALLERRLEVGEAFSELSKPSPEEIVSFWREKAKCLIPRSVRGFVDDSRDDFANLRALQADGTLERAKSVGDALVEDLQKLLQIWEQIECAAKEDDWFTVLSHFGPLRKHMKQKGRTENWKPANPKEAIKRLQQRYDETLGSLFGDEEKINKDLDLKMAEILLVLSRLFDFACKQYRAMKEERNGLDYDDLEEKALALLRRRPDIQEQWQQEIRAVLVDEFQDTNGRQRDLVRLLSGDGGKLFLVGDAKQSIYRFRGADVTVFRQERERIGNIYPLEITYRAHRGLVEGLNALLRPVLGDTEDCQKPWREPFAPIKAYRAEPRPGFTSPYIELHLAVGSKKEGALDRAADALAVRLRELVEEKQVQTGEGNRNSSPISYSDVAILCRASTSFKAYEDALERAGIPYLTVAGRGFYDRPEIRDLLNALQALANPTDDLALTGLLRSPAFGLSDAALYLLRKSKRTTLWETIQQRGALDLLDDEDRQRTERAYRIIEELYQQVGRVSVADLLKEFLDRTAYRAVLLRAGQERAARNVDKLISDAHTSGMVGVGEFLEYIQSLRDVGVRESEARAGAEGSVQIMTAHAAKGLEFPIVVLGDANYSSRGRSEILLLDCSLKVLLPLKDKEGRVSAVYWLGKLRSDDQEEAEEDRLLYVAATRAREMVLVSGCVSCKDARFRLEGWLKRLGAPLELDQITYKGETLIDRVVEGIPVRFFFYDQSFQPPSRLASPSVRPAETALDFPLLNPVLPREEALDAKAAQRESVLPQRVWQVVSQAKHPHAPAWVVGSLVHDALAVWRFPDVEFSAWAEARARSYGITDPQELKDAVSRSRLLLNRFRAHALFTEMAQADRRFHEVPYSLVVDGRVESGVIDALYRHGGQWTLVEFKTDEVRGEKEMEELLSKEDYLPQIRRYVLAVEKMLGERPRALLCLLNYRGGIHIKEI